MATSLRDYQHASKIFLTGGSYDRVPKYKWLFHVNFIFKAGAYDTKEASFICKSVEMPKFSFNVKDLNQYNRRAWAQTGVKYEPVTIKFHDDSSDNLRDLIGNYYRYYYVDGNKTDGDYTNTKYSSTNTGGWGLDNGATEDFLSRVEIYSFANGNASKITLENPVIVSFTHDVHDYSETMSSLEATMSLRYTGVIYASGDVNSIPGFGDSDSYDTTAVDPNTNDIGGTFTNAGTGLTNTGISTDSNTGSLPTNTNPSLEFTNGSTPAFSPSEIQQIIDQTKQQQASQFNFPTIDNTAPVYSFSTEYVFSNYDPSTSDGEVLYPNGNLYIQNTWQSNLLKKGYTLDQIHSAADWISSIDPTVLAKFDIQQLAQQYITNPQAALLSIANYAQNAAKKLNVDYTNPVSSIQPVYNSADWKQRLKDLGYSNSEIKLTDEHIRQLNVSPDTDLVALAVDYIAYINSSNFLTV
jgi:hypothetical protein